MPRFDKWLTGVGSKARVSTAARKALKPRLKAVEHYLQEAAQLPPSRTEAVHQLRVWCRRTEAALRLFEQVVPTKKFAWFRRKLKQIRRAAGEARDCDVLLSRLRAAPASPAAERLTQSVVARRKAAKPILVECYESLGASGRWNHKTRKLLGKLAWQLDGDEPRFSEWCQARLAASLGEFLKLAQRRVTQPAALHAVRIAGKHLRYTLEIVAIAFGGSVRNGLYADLSAIQERLGQVCDHTAAQSQFRELKLAAQTPDDRRYFAAAARSEQQLFQSSLAQFLKWWSPARKRAFVAKCKKCGLLPANADKSKPRNR